MNAHTQNYDQDTQRLNQWFRVADMTEIRSRQDDSTALVDYLSFCNDLTMDEAAEMLETLAPNLLQNALEKHQRAA